MRQHRAKARHLGLAEAGGDRLGNHQIMMMVDIDLLDRIQVEQDRSGAEAAGGGALARAADDVEAHRLDDRLG